MKVPTLTYCETLEEAYPFLASEYRLQGRVVPHISAVFIGYYVFEFGSWYDYSRKIKEQFASLSEQLQLSDKIPYFCHATSGRGGTERIRRHYKVWKSLADFDLESFQLGAECEFVMNRYGEDVTLFGSTARVAPEGLGKALDILSSVSREHEDMKMRSMLYFTENESLTDAKQTENLFALLRTGTMPPLPSYLFDVSNLLDAMKPGEALLLMHSGSDISGDIASTIILRKEMAGDGERR